MDLENKKLPSPLNCNMVGFSKFVKGTVWAFADNLSGSGINFLVGILLARQLPPETFGIVGIAMFLILISTTIVDGGLSNALIRKQDVDDCDYNTTLFLNISVAIVLYAILWVSAPFLANWYKAPELLTVIPILSLVLVISSLGVVPKAMLTKSLNFKPQAIASLSASLAGAAVGLTLVYTGYGIWSLVFQQIIRQTIYVIVIWGQMTQWPRLVFSYQRAKELFAFGARILMSALLDTAYNNAFLMIIGKLYTPRQLGLYTRADQFTSILTSNFGMVIQRVSLPTFAKCKDDTEAFTTQFCQILKFSAMFAALLCLSLSAMADHFVLLIIGEQWQESIYILRILCFAGLFHPIIIAYQNILQVHGLSKLFLNIELTKKAMSVGTVGITFFLGFTYLLWGVVIIAFMSFLINSYIVRQYLPCYPLRKQYFDIIRTLSPIAILSLGVYYCGTFTTNHLSGLTLQMATLLIAILCYLSLFHRALLHQRLGSILHLMRKK